MKNMLTPANLQNWIETCAIAWRLLCNGDNGCAVKPRESWPSAISRLAATILADSGYGLPKGYDSARWDYVTREFAARQSCARDGRVAGPKGRVYITSLPSEPLRPTMAELIEKDWDKVPVLE